MRNYNLSVLENVLNGGEGGCDCYLLSGMDYFFFLQCLRNDGYSFLYVFGLFRNVKYFKIRCFLSFVLLPYAKC